MRPDDREIDDEIRADLALNIKERVDRGEDPESARRAALRDLGYRPAVHDAVRRVWYSRWSDAAAALLREMRIGLRSLTRSKGLAATVVITLGLGIGVNAAIFSVVRGVLLRPLVNREEDRLVYLRQSAQGLGLENLTFSMPEYHDLKARNSTLAAFGDFSAIDMTLLGLGDPRVVHAGVVGGSYFDVVGLRPALGRLIGPADDGKDKAPVVVLTHRFWTTTFHRDDSVIGQPIRLGPVVATIVGVLEPSLPYPVDVQLVANVVTSPHHLGATMNVERLHRMTELFGRLAPGATVEQARADLNASYAAMLRDHPETYTAKGQFQISVTPLRDQITAPARPILLILLAAAAVVFLIACSNIANLILARSVRREGELAVRAALGASPGALRRTLLAESLVLCGLGATFGLLLARPMVLLVAQYASQFSVRALDVRVDDTLLWVGAGLAIAAAILLAYVPRLPSSLGAAASGLAAGNVRLTPSTNRRLRAFATAQIAFSFVLLTGAGMLVTSLIALETTRTGLLTTQVLAFDVPPISLGSSVATTKPQEPPPPEPDRYEAVATRIRQLPGVEGVSSSYFVPWRDAGKWAPVQFAVEGYTPANGEENPFARSRLVGPSYFSTLGIQMVAGREFNDHDRMTKDRIVIVSQAVARRLFPNSDALNRNLSIVASLNSSGLVNTTPYRIIGVAADVEDETVEGTPAMAVYRFLRDKGLPWRMFVRASGDPHALAPIVTRIIQEESTDQAVDRPATLADVRAEVLTPDRLNTLVVTGFAGIALLIAVVGVAGVLAFSVNARMREFGIRLAVGSSPRRLLMRVLAQGASIVAIGIASGVAGAYLMAAGAASVFAGVRMPGLLSIVASAVVLGVAATLASLMPAARASRVDVLEALRAER